MTRRSDPPSPLISLVAPTAIFLATALYLGITAASITHMDLLTGGKVALPVLAVGVPIVGPLGFCWIGPLLLFGLHLSLLLRHYVAVQAAKEAGLLGERSDPTFALAFPAVGSPRSLPRWRLRYLVKWSFLASLGALPLVVLVIFQVSFLPYHGFWVTLLHQILIALDLALIWYFVGSMTTPSLSLRRSFWIRGPRHRGWWLLAPLRFLGRRPTKTVSAVLSLWLLVFVSWVAVIPGTGLEACWGEGPWPSCLRPIKRNLKLQNSTLVRSAPDTELLVYELERADALGQGDSEDTVLEAWRKHSRGLDLSGRNLRDADLSGARLHRVNLTDADLRGARLEGAHLEGADLASGTKGTVLDGANLRGAHLRRADFTRASLVGADLRDATGLGVVLRGAVLRDARAQNVKLDEADVAGALLDGADLAGASLRAANLDDASLVGAVLTGADLSDASLRSADLRGALLPKVNARAADFWFARTFGAVFRRARLDKVVGLETPGVDLNQATFAGADLGWEMGVDEEGQLVRYRQVPQTPAPNLTDLRGVEAFRLVPPSRSAPILYDQAPASPGMIGLAPPARPSPFFAELSWELVRKACAETSKPQLMEAIIRRSVGCSGPREPLLERALRSDLIAAADPQRNRCPVLSNPPAGLVEALEAVENGGEISEPGATFLLCAPSPLLDRNREAH